MERRVLQGAWLPGRSEAVTDPAVIAAEASPEELAQLTREGAIEGFEDLMDGPVELAPAILKQRASDAARQAASEQATAASISRDEVPSKPVSQQRALAPHPKTARSRRKR